MGDVIPLPQRLPPPSGPWVWVIADLLWEQRLRDESCSCGRCR